MSRVEEIYVQALEGIVRKQQRVIDRITDGAKQIRIAERRARKLEEELERLKGWKSDPVVLVRSSVGAPRRAYHSATNPCGHVRNVDEFRRILLGEAERWGLRGCHACGNAENLYRNPVVIGAGRAAST